MDSILSQALKRCGRGSAAIALFEFAGELGLRQKANPAEPYLVDDFSIAPAEAPDILTVTGGPRGEADVSAICAGYGNFARIRERVWQRGGSDDYLAGHRHEIDCTPGRPPPAGPVANLAGRRAALREGCQDVNRSVQPAIGWCVHRIGDNRHGDRGIW